MSGIRHLRKMKNTFKQRLDTIQIIPTTWQQMCDLILLQNYVARFSYLFSHHSPSVVVRCPPHLPVLILLTFLLSPFAGLASLLRYFPLLLGISQLITEHHRHYDKPTS